jgi:hypothetical protein
MKKQGLGLAGSRHRRDVVARLAKLGVVAYEKRKCVVSEHFADLFERLPLAQIREQLKRVRAFKNKDSTFGHGTK